MAPRSTTRHNSPVGLASIPRAHASVRPVRRTPVTLRSPSDRPQTPPAAARSDRQPKVRQRRDRGGGSVVARVKADGTTVYDAFFTFCDPATGAPRRSCKRGFPTSAAAGKYLRAQTTQVDARSYVPPTRLTLADYLEQWLDALRLAPQTVGNYRVWVRTHLVPHLGHLTLSEITPLHLNAMYNALERTGSHLVCCHSRPCGRRDGTGPLSRSSVRHVHNTLSAALRDAVDAGLLASSPTARAKPPTLRQAKAQRSPFTTWTAEQLSAFLTRWQDHRYSPLWHLLATTGLRRGEALGLRWQDVDLERGTAAVRQTVGLERTRGGTRETFIQPTVKNGRPHMIALDPGTVAVLRRHRAEQDGQRLQLGEGWTDLDLVFCRDAGWLAADSRPGLPLRGERVSALWRELADRTPEVPRIRLHDLRHTWATLALTQGVHPKVVQERLNHANIGITLDLYSHTTVGMDRAAADQVAGLLRLPVRA